MAHKSFNRIRETATAPGTGSFTLNGAVQGAQTFGARLASTNRVWYVATNGTAWEVGYGTFTSPTTLARTTILESSNADAVVNFSSGTVDIFCVLPSSVTDTLNIIEETVTSAATFDIGAVHGLRILASGTTGPVTSLGTTPNKLRIVRWAGATVTHHATSLILLGGLSRTTAAGDIGIYVSDGSGNWRELVYQRADGHSLTTGHSTIASATTTELGSVLGQSIIVSGTTTITGFGSTAPTGAIKSVEFSGALLLTYNATSLILPGAASITTVAGDCAIFRHEGSGNWRCLSFVRVNGHPLTTGHSTIASATTTDLGSVLGQSIIVSGTTTITGLGSTAPIGAIKSVEFSGALILTHNATSLILPGAANITTVAGDNAIFRHESAGNWRCINYSRGTLVPIDGAAWTSYSPTITPGSGAFTTVAATEALYKLIGKTCHLRLKLLLTTIGTAAARTDVTLPFNAASASSGDGINASSHTKMTALVREAAAGSLSFYKYDGTFGWTSGDTVYISATFEIA